MHWQDAYAASRENRKRQAQEKTDGAHYALAALGLLLLLVLVAVTP